MNLPEKSQIDRHIDADHVALALGLDPMEVAAESLTLEPFGAKVLVRWQGIRLVSPEDAARALGVNVEVGGQS